MTEELRKSLITASPEHGNTIYGLATRAVWGQKPSCVTPEDRDHEPDENARMTPGGVALLRSWNFTTLESRVWRLKPNATILYNVLRASNATSDT